MTKGFISIVILLITGSLHIYSQDIYRFTYESPDANEKIEYEAFFSLSANGSGIIRVKPSNNKSLTVEMEFQETYAIDKEGNPDLTYAVYEGKNPRVVMGDKSLTIKPVTFWFKKNADDFYDPWAVSASNTNTPPPISNFRSALFIKSNELTRNKKLLSLFFADTSAYYKNFLGPNSRGGTLSPEEKKITRIFLIVVASTNDPVLLPNCLIDARKIVNYFTEIAINVLGLPKTNLKIDSVYGQNYSRENVELAINKIQPTKNDLVIFYYSGHGFHNNKMPDKIFPFFDLRDPIKPKFYKDLETKTLNVEDIYKTIVNKGARFNLVLSDCCNDTVAAPKRKWYDVTKKKGLSKANFANVKALFMSKQQVNLLMTAATKDEQAVVTPSFNSYFTYFFLQSLTTYLGPEKGFPTWPQVLAATQSQTIKQVSGLPCKENNCPKQTPKMLIPGIR
jgi:Caspase domain